MASTEETVDPSADTPADPRAFPLISVRIASYNHEHYILDTLRSVANETYPNLELVITDDCSTDGTAAAIRAWICRNPQIPTDFVENAPNQGIAKNLNATLKRCRGEYIVSLASDDYLLPGGIMQRYRYLQRNPGKRAVFADCIVVDSDGQTLHESGLTGLHSANIERLKTAGGIRKEFILNWSVPGPVLMIHRSILVTVGYYDEQLAIEDWDFYLRMANRNLIGFTNETVSAYRVHGKNTCMIPEDNLKRLQAFKKTLVKNLPDCGLGDRLRALYKIRKFNRWIRKQVAEQAQAQATD